MRILSVITAVAFGLAAAAAAAPASAQPSKGGLPACVEAPALGETITCGCQISEPGTAVWGVGPYTNDSDICTAAVHAGLMSFIDTPNGPELFGEFDVTGSEGCVAYGSSSANGVTTFSYGAYPQSYFFPAVQTGECSAEVADVSEDGKPVVDAGGAEMCPVSMPDGVKSLSCGCTAEGTEAGFVWGTDLYTADSSICRAALHAGVVGAGGGVVNVVRSGGLDAYTGSTRNGATSDDWGAYPETISFR